MKTFARVLGAASLLALLSACSSLSGYTPQSGAGAQTPSYLNAAD